MNMIGDVMQTHVNQEDVNVEIVIGVDDMNRFINYTNRHIGPAVGWDTVMRESNRIYKAILLQKSK